MCPNLDGELCSIAHVLVTPAGCSLCRSQWEENEPPTCATPTPFLIDLQTLPPHDPRPRGLGDTIAATLAKFGIRKRRGCGCSKRQALLNRLVPYK